MPSSPKTASKDNLRKATPAGPRKRAKTARTAARPDLDAEAGIAPVASPEPVPKPVPAPAPAAGDGTAAVDTRFKRPDLIEAVAERTSLKRADAKVVLELVLDELGRALDTNEELVLPPLGKVMVKKRKPDADGPDILTLKIRRPRPDVPGAGETPLADPNEDG